MRPMGRKMTHFIQPAEAWGVKFTPHVPKSSLPYLWHMRDSVVMKPESVRTTVDIPAPLYRKLKEQAAAQGHSVRELVLAGIRNVLLQRQRPRPKRVRFPLINSD